MCDFDIKNKEKFWKVYEEEILPKLKEEDVNRINKIKTICMTSCLKIFALVIVLGASFYFYSYSFIDRDSIWGQLMIWLAIILCIVIDTPQNNIMFKFKLEKDYAEELKKKFIRKFLNVFKGIEPVEFSQALMNVSDKTGLFPKWIQDRYIDDKYCGKYMGINYWISDETLKLKQFTFFKGCILEIDLNKNIKGNTIISGRSSMYIPKKILLIFILPMIILFLLCLMIMLINFPNMYIRNLNINNIIIFLVILLIAWKVRNKLFIRKEKINLEDLKFNNMYASYSTDQVEGRYAITPAFMERLLNLKLAFKAKNISASFYDNKLMIAIETKKDLFEIGNLWHPLTDRKYAEDFYNEMSSIIKMIEYFKLDEKTGL